MNNYYIYIYLDPRKLGQYCYNNICFLYEPFYIGKGKKYRLKDETKGRNKYFKNKINKIKNYGLEPIVFKLYENLNEDQSFNLEKQLIKEIGRYDLNFGLLLNMTDGGEGSSGSTVSEETRNKMSSFRKGKHTGSDNPMFGKFGENNPFFGKKHSDESKNKMSETRKSMYKGKDNPMFGKHRSELWKKDQSDRMKENPPSHKLNKNDIIFIKMIFREFKNEISCEEISKIFNVHKNTIYKIKTKKRWNHIILENL